MRQFNINYPSINETMDFSSYIAACKEFLKENRSIISYPNTNIETVIEANSPFEYSPNTLPAKHGALLIHGLFDCPFTLREIGKYLQENGILSRAILLPGHGTQPQDLLSVEYKDWINVVRYAINTLKKETKYIFLIGYSTGAALSLYHALNNDDIAGLILIAPAIKIKVSTHIVGLLKHWKNLLTSRSEWIYIDKDIDFAKYRSFAFKPVQELEHLMKNNETQLKTTSISCPIQIIISDDDETVSSQAAINFFTKQIHPNNHLIVYSNKKNNLNNKNKKITIRNSYYPDLNIQNFSHISLPFSQDNFHYGQYGDFPFASHINVNNTHYGAYNIFKKDFYASLFKLKLIKNRKLPLTYNPDFNFLAKSMVDFIFLSTNAK